MSYADRAALLADPTFVGRLNACVANEAAGKPADPFVDMILRSWGFGAQAFGTLIIALPGFDVPEPSVTDGMILSGVQAVWSRAEALSGVSGMVTP